MSYKFKMTRKNAFDLLGELVRFLGVKVEFKEFNIIVDCNGICVEPIIVSSKE